jgi:hypothetical protein
MSTEPEPDDPAPGEPAGEASRPPWAILFGFAFILIALIAVEIIRRA